MSPVSTGRRAEERAHSPLSASTLSAFLRRENNALAGQSPVFKDSQRFNAAAVKTSEQKTSGAPHLWGCCGPRTLPACLPTDRPPIGPFKSEVHPKLQRLAPPRDGDEVTASLRSTLAIPSSRARSVRLDDCAVSRYDRGAEWKERTGERMGERGKALLWQQNRTGCSAMAFLFQATGVCAAGLCVCVEEDLHNRGYLLQSASRCSKTRLGIPFVTFSERDSLMCLFCVFQP